MTEVTHNQYGLTEQQVGKSATDDKPAQYPLFDVRGQKYQRGAISMYPLTKETFVVVPAGFAWTKEDAAKAYKAAPPGSVSSTDEPVPTPESKGKG